MKDSPGHGSRLSVPVGVSIRWVTVALALVYAWRLRWVSEDAYISFRYARNLIEGHGLVFNVGERVEGYTNFLWTLLVAPGLALGLEPLTISSWLGLGATAVSLFLLLSLHGRIVGPGARVPVAVVTLALNYTWACFSTSGLETSLLVALLAGTMILLLDDAPSKRAAAGALAALAMMTRPDAALLIPPAIAFLALERRGMRRFVRDALVFLGPLLLVFAPYFVWRSSYYGHVFPNTYYAKAAYLPHYEQGLIYVWELARRYFLWAFVPLPLIWAVRGALRRRLPDPAVALVGSYVVLHTFYVVRVGGDFMEGRFLFVALPFAYVLIERAARELVRPRVAVAIVLALLVLSTGVDRRIIEPGVINEDGIADERTWVPVFERWLRAGAVFGEHLPPGTPVATDAVGAFGWSSRLPLVDTLGLVDETVAHGPLGERSRVGHDKAATPEYLRTRHVAVLRDGREMYRFERPPELQFAGDRYYLLSVDPAVVHGFEDAARELRTADR